MKKKRYEWSEEEKAAFKVAFTAMKKLMDDMEPQEMSDDPLQAERPYDEEGNKVEKQLEDDEEERWLKSVMMELRDSK
jgi:hypothetical protein